MRYALISDVHANLEALTVILDRIKKEKVDEIYCAGDIVGYGPNPVECVDLIIKNNIKTVKGNHEALDRYCEEGFSNNEILELKWTKIEISSKKKEYLEYLINLPEIISENDIYIVHGSPFDHLGKYINNDKNITKNIQNNSYNRAKKRFLVVGHTHKPFDRKIKNGFIINPGSVGQPRDKNSKTSFSILDTDIPEVKNIRLKYEINTTIMKIIKSGLSPKNADRLLLGL